MNKSGNLAIRKEGFTGTDFCAFMIVHPPEDISLVSLDPSMDRP
jgi:hypothetical protein